jgi:hypothetical protein
MLIVHGTYQFSAKRIAFRNDFCANCRLPCRATQVRTFDVHHIFWIPLIPTGFRKRWYCARCGRQPDVYAGTRRPFKWIGLFLLIVLTPAFWFMPLPGEQDRGFIIFIWVLKLAAPLGVIFTAWHLHHTRNQRPRKDLLERVAPAAADACPFCNTPLIVLSGRASCPSCGVLRL